MSDNKKETIIASFIYLIFHSELSGFCVSTFKEKKGKNFKCVGNELPTYKNVDYELTGSWEKDKNGDQQFRVDAFSEHVEKEKDSIITFLSSGAIKGIGKKTAERIFNMFGLESLDVIEKRPENLLKVRGISPAKLDRIIESYSENHLPKDLIELLIPCGFTTKNALMVYKKYKNEAILKIQEDPYILCSFYGISFPMADRVAGKYNISGADRRRIHAAVYEALKENFFNGRVGSTIEELIYMVAKLTGLRDEKAIRNNIISMTKAELIVYRKTAVDGNVVTFFYLEDVKRTEEKLAEEILKNIGKKDKSKGIDKYLNNDLDISFDKEQVRAITNAFTYKLSIITGGPGTGKTTITKKIAEINEAISKETPVFLAPTGKAARKITESTGIDAYTIHSYLNLRPSGDETDSYDEVEHVVIKDKTVIIDEFSMVDMKLALILFERMINCRVVIVGDPDQLQSVGAGNVLLDMISSKVIPTTKLVYEHRQGKGSTIKKNANGMQEGLLEFQTAEDFICAFEKGVNTEDTLKRIEDKAVNEYLKYFRDPSYENVVCLCPYKNYTAGMYSINRRLQEVINPGIYGQPEFKGIHDMVFRIGDPIMHIEKNTDEVSNGNTGYVKAIRKVDNELTLFAEYDLGNKTVIVEYTAQNIKQLTLSYAMTVHKSQGSEYDAVVTVLSAFHKMMLKRRIPYTAITRAKKCVSVIMDDKETLKTAIENNQTEDRHTLLAYLLREKSNAKTIVPINKKLTKNEGIEGQLSLSFAQ